MSMNTANKGKDIFDNDFEVIYEGDLPDINIDTDDNYKDVLSSLSDLDTTKHIDYVEENYTTSFDEMPEEYMKQRFSSAKFSVSFEERHSNRWKDRC